MEHTKKLMLVHPMSYFRQQKAEYKVPNATTNVLGSLDSEMKNILDGGYNEDEKIKLYEQALQRYITMYKKHTSTTIPFQAPRHGVLEDDVLGSVPKSFKTNAAFILNTLKKSGHVTWNDKGEVVYDGNVHTGTHVSDLLNDILRRRKQFDPHGTAEFVSALKQARVPETVIGHKERWFSPRSLGERTDYTPQASPDFQTPKTSKGRTIAARLKWDHGK